MTAKQAQDAINKQYPALKRENSVMWAVIFNLLEQVEDGRKANTCKPPQLKVQIAPAPVRFRRMEEHGENIQL